MMLEDIKVKDCKKCIKELAIRSSSFHPETNHTVYVNKKIK